MNLGTLRKRIIKRRTFLTHAAAVPSLWLTGCGGSKTLLSPKDPTMLSIWHIYGEQADSPMNRLLTEFNDTVGKTKHSAQRDQHDQQCRDWQSAAGGAVRQARRAGLPFASGRAECTGTRCRRSLQRELLRPWQ